MFDKSAKAEVNPPKSNSDNKILAQFKTKPKNQMKNSRLKASILTCSILGATSASAVIELDVVAVIPPTVGVQSTSTAVTPVIGQTAAFELSLFDTDTLLTSTAYLTVELDSFGTGLTTHWISDGQGGNTDRVGIAVFGGTTDRTADYTFSFFSDPTYMTPLSLGEFAMQVTDIDPLEEVIVSTSDFSSVTLDVTTDLDVDTSGGEHAVTNIVAENTDKSDPIAAANFNAVSGVSSFTVSLEGGGAGGREFQFDFNPDIVIPEPSSYALIIGALALTGVAFNRRRSAK